MDIDKFEKWFEAGYQAGYRAALASHEAAPPAVVPVPDRVAHAKQAAMTSYALAAQVNDLAAITRRLLHALNHHNPGSKVASRAAEYLKRNNLQGSPLRVGDVLRDAAVPAPAHPVGAADNFGPTKDGCCGATVTQRCDGCPYPSAIAPAHAKNKRQAFEAWVPTILPPGTEIRQLADGFYSVGEVSAAWATWQYLTAPAQAAVPAQAVDALGIKTWQERMPCPPGSAASQVGYMAAEIADLRAALAAQPAAPAVTEEPPIFPVFDVTQKYIGFYLQTTSLEEWEAGFKKIKADDVKEFVFKLGDVERVTTFREIWNALHAAPAGEPVGEMHVQNGVVQTHDLYTSELADGFYKLCIAAPVANAGQAQDKSGWDSKTLVTRLYNDAPTYGLLVEAGAEIQALRQQLAVKAGQAQAVAVPDAKFHIGAHVRKTKGSQWSGKVVGTYSTALTPEGYAVESSTEKGSVQIYPAAALELIHDEAAK